MEPEFWQQRWRDNLIGFHQADVNLHLEQFWPELPLDDDDTVFVPLCGKSRDMLWLAQYHPVLGVEVSPIAVEAFFEENELEAERSEEGAFEVFECENIRVLCGDVFDLKAEQLSHVRAVYDRASLIALPPEMRTQFAQHLDAVLPREVEMLLVTLDYPQDRMDGPPFSVSAGEVLELFGSGWSIEHMFEDDVLAREVKFQERGLTYMTENVFRLRRG